MKNKKFNLQIFADAVSVRVYQKDFKELLKVIFGTKSYFSDFFAGGLEAKDGVQHKDTAFSVKTSDIPVVVGTEYNKDANTAFGTGTGSTSRFGERTEIVYTDTDVDYSWEWAMHEGIDRTTVNNDFDVAVADRLELQANAKINKFNTKHAAFISAAATAVASGEATITADNVATVFNTLHKKYVNMKAVGVLKAKVTADVYSAIVDSKLSTTSKGSSANVDENEIRKFKGFLIEELPEDLFAANEVIYTYIEGVGKAFTGIETARTIESEDFDGVALQGHGKAGEYILPANKPAVLKVTVTGA